MQPGAPKVCGMCRGYNLQDPENKIRWKGCQTNGVMVPAAPPRARARARPEPPTPQNPANHQGGGESSRVPRKCVGCVGGTICNLLKKKVAGKAPKLTELWCRQRPRARARGRARAARTPQKLANHRGGGESSLVLRKCVGCVGGTICNLQQKQFAGKAPKLTELWCRQRPHARASSLGVLKNEQNGGG